MIKTTFDWNLIDLKGKTSGQTKTTCPVCSHTRRNKHERCLSVNVTKGLANCHHCGMTSSRESGFNTIEPPMPYQKPSKKNITKLNTQGLKYFEDRKITQEVLNSNKICSDKSGKGIVYPYLEDGELVNFKVRYFETKDFRQAKEAKPIMFNYDRIKNSESIIINEGEEDSMSWEVAGIPWHTSVNQGAPNENDKNVDKKLECVTNCFEAFEQAKTIYIGVDNDANGRRLKNELIRRFDPAKIKIIDYSPCKDANNFLCEYGPEKLKSLLDEAADVKIEGIFTVSDVMSDMLDGFRHGKHRGTTTYIPDLDELWTWRETEVNTWSGYENEGKSTFLKQLKLIKSLKEGKRHAFFTPEDMPIGDFFDDLIEMMVGKSCDPYYSKILMSEEEYVEAAEFVKKHFFVIYPQKDFKLQTIFEKIKYLKRKEGIWSVTIDPYNTVEHLQRGGEREELYISRFMADLKRLAVENFMVVDLVAHQNTARINEKDGLYYTPWKSNIKGGGVFAQKSDNVLMVSRPNFAKDKKCNIVRFSSDKIKKQKLVGIPGELTNITFHRPSNRYYFGGFSPLAAPDEKKKPEDRVNVFIQPQDAFGNPTDINDLDF